MKRGVRWTGFVLLACVVALVVLGVWIAWDQEPSEAPLAGGTELPGSGGAIALEQGWSERSWERTAYTSIGSRLLPRNWFLVLERSDDTGFFRDDSNLARFGFLPQGANEFNPDGLPVGLAIAHGGDSSYVGLTCAACHTGELRYGGKRLRIAGGAGMIDIAAFEDALLQSLQSTAADQTKFSRFSAHAGNPPQLRDDLERSIKRLGRRTRINHVDVPYGPGRMDAFGQIFNAVSAEFLDLPANFHTPDAPVSIPSLWNTPRMTRVQWNGSSPNTSIAPLVQNVTTALAVYGDADLQQPGILGYRSSVDIAALGHLQRRNTQLRSPVWPEDWFGKLDRAAIARGHAVYANECVRCHVEADRNDNAQTLATTLIPVAEIGTDPKMACNFVDRRVDTGVLAGRPSMLWGGAALNPDAHAIDLVVHASIGAALQQPLLALRAAWTGHGSAGTASASDTPAYKAGPLAGIWATAPYLHNGSVPTLQDLLLAPEQRPVEFSIGAGEFDPDKVGVKNDVDGSRFDTRLPGNHNSGHVFGTKLDSAQKADLLEFLKSL
jgi:hypothetical protein